MSTQTSWIRRDEAVIWHGFTQMATYGHSTPVIVEKAEGHTLIDVNGNRYFDGISSLWVNTLGHRIKELDEALIAQLNKVAHSTMLGNGNETVIRFAEALCKRVPVEDPHILFGADGAVAVEQALKIAFQYWANLAESGRNQFLALTDAYHGDTIGALSLGDGGFFSEVFDPLRFRVRRTAGYADPSWADKAIAAIGQMGDTLAALVVEPLVQGASGMLCSSPEDLSRVVKACQGNGALVIFDEVATGFGRTGTLFAAEQAGVQPDILCLGKGITGGYLAMSATVANKKVFEAFLGEDLSTKTFYHGHSYGGNALGAAVGLRHLELLEEENVLDNVRARSFQFKELLCNRLGAGIKEVRQCGLMIGVQLAPPAPGLLWGRQVCAACVRRGVLLRPLGDVVVIMAPLTITEDETKRVVDVLCEAIVEVCTP